MVTVPLAAKTRSACAIASQLSPASTVIGAADNLSLKNSIPVVGEAGKTNCAEPLFPPSRSTASNSTGR